MPTLTIPATLDALGDLGQFVVAVSTAAGLDRRATYHLRLAVDEIATNAIVHGNAASVPGATLRVEADVGAEWLRVILEDPGLAFDPRRRPKPADLDRPLHERAAGGLGIYLALQSVDRFDYERVDNLNRNIFEMKRS